MVTNLSVLNNEQRVPVLDTEGAVLVTAGAGSGKTRLLTHRIAYIINDLCVEPYRILALTFTNKAAGEMRERLEKMGCAQGVWIFTFHGLCVRILRKYIDLIGFKSTFTIYGESESNALLKRIYKENGIEEDDLSLSEVSKVISDSKCANLTADEFLQVNKFRHNVDLIAKVFSQYESGLKKNNALDYDDLLNFTLKLLKTHDEPREYYQDKFKYIHIDEFQDTNTVQYEIVRILSGKWGNIFAVGDEDQSIYGWRGADFRNIFNFRKDFKNVRTYKLEQNYRSTKKIINLANKVIKNNTQRLDKNLWTENGEGAPVVYYKAQSDKDEANYVLNAINRLITFDGYKKSDFAILMRINALTRNFEEKFVQYGVPHKIFGGFKFFDRKEIKDVLAYLKVLDNHDDEESLLRIINFPKRGIGDATVMQARNYALVKGISLYDVIISIENNADLPLAVVKKLIPVSTVFKCLENALNTCANPSILTKYLCKIIGLKAVYEDDTEENLEHRANIKELVHSMEEYEKGNSDFSLSDYLQTVSLYSDTDEMDDSDYVTLATVHSAKGLEFKVVFLVGMEDGVFPSSRSVEEDGRLEEERRLLYVAITRAREKLYITRAKTRFKYGSTDFCAPSKFLKEMGFEEKATEQQRESSYGGYSSGSYGNYYNRAQSKVSDAYKPDEVPAYDDTPSKVIKLKTTIGDKGGKDVSKFVVGAKVRHKKFGEGVITKVSKIGEVCVTVSFVSLGEISLMLNYAPLELI